MTEVSVIKELIPGSYETTICLNVLTHFMIAFYYITLNILKSYVVLSCFRIIKMENGPR